MAARDLGRHALDLEQVAHEADAQALHAGLEPGGEVLGGPLDARGVHRVLAADGVEHERALLDRLGERPDLVERARERDAPVAGDASVGGLHRHRAAQRARLADRAAGVAAQRDVAIPALTAAAEPPEEPPGYALEVPRVVRRAERGVLGRGAERELVHVELADGQRAGVQEPRDRGAVVDALVVLEDPRGAGRLRADQVHVVLERRGHARKRRQLVGARPLDHVVDLVGRGVGEFGRHLVEGVDAFVERIDARERGVGHLACAELAADDACPDLGGREGREVDVLAHA